MGLVREDGYLCNQERMIHLYFSFEKYIYYVPYTILSAGDKWQ